MFDYLTSFFYYVVISISSTHVLLWIWKELSMGICRCKGNLKGKIVLITGGNNGIGFETSLELARRGAKLIIGCRKIQNLETRIQKIVPGAEVEAIRLDLSSNASIKKFAEEVKSKYDIIDVLINNAGMVTRDMKKSEDGFELLMATNYLGHALLNHLLLDLVKKAGEVVGGDCSRIILVSSLASADKKAANDLCQFRHNNSYDVDFGVKIMRHQYGKSKLAQIMYGKHLARLLSEEDKCNTMVASLHPGFVRTDIFQGLPPGPQLKFISWIGYVLGKSSWQGAQTTVHLAICNFSHPMNETSGTFFCDCRSKNWFNFHMPKIIKDPVACKSVYDETMRLLKL